MSGLLDTVAWYARTCALRAPTVYSVRIKTIRTEYTVMDKSKKGLRSVFCKIADCARMCFSSVRDR